MRKICKCLWSFFCEISIACFAFGQWYEPKPVGHPLPSDKYDIMKSRRPGVNYLYDQQKHTLYVNNFYPYHREGKVADRELCDIFHGKGLLTEDDLDKVVEICSGALSSTPTDGTIQYDVYGNILRKLAYLCISYLKTFGLDNAAKGLKEQIEIAKQQEFDGKILFDFFKGVLTDYKVMRPIWDCMHTEYLLVFDKYYSPSTITEEEVTFSYNKPEETLSFVSQYDMCELCESLMVNTLMEMGSVPSAEFTPPSRSEADYKILVGSFFPWLARKDRELLKVRMAFLPVAVDGVKRAQHPSSSQGTVVPAPSQKTPRPIIVRSNASSTGTNIQKECTASLEKP